jgi:NADP-dependent 3-hydroxy acid dehydrogenase YdfG
MSAGRVAVVTGASSGIGRAIAVGLGALGWPVAIGARRADKLEETAELVTDAGGAVLPCRLDVTDAGSVETFVATVEDRLGPVDVLVNNAGIAVPGTFWELTAEQMDLEVRTNVLGPFLCTRRVLPSMVRRRAGDVVFISSDTVRAPRPGLLGYGATKAAIEVAARGLTMELEGTGVRTTTVRVGPTLSDFGTGWNAEQITALMETWPRFGIQRHMNTLDPGDVARAVVYAVTAPAGVNLDLMEVQPEPPLSEGPR